MSIREKFEATLAPAIDCKAPYAKVMIAKLVAIAVEATNLRAPEIERLNEALAESVKLQSHYAGLLNEYDGGKRMQFANAEAWIARLEAVHK